MLADVNSTLYRFIHTICTLGFVTMFFRSKNPSYSIKIQFLKNYIISHYCLVYHYQINLINTDLLNMSWNVWNNTKRSVWLFSLNFGMRKAKSVFCGWHIVQLLRRRTARVVFLSWNWRYSFGTSYYLSSEWELLSTNCWDAARTTHTNRTNSLYEFCDIV